VVKECVFKECLERMCVERVCVERMCVERVCVERVWGREVVTRLLDVFTRTMTEAEDLFHTTPPYKIYTLTP
jgi:hypothetical protein